MADTSLVGMNLSGDAYFSDEYPFIDRMKTAGSWIANGATAPVPLDKDGYPTGIPAGATSLYTLVGLDPPSAGTDNTYVLTYTGQADFFLGYANILSSEPGKIVFQYTNPDSGQMLLAMDDLDPSNPIGNMHIVRSDQVDLFNSGEIFNPAFTAKVSQFDTLRYMDWGNTNVSTVQNWADRTPADNVTWSTATGVPIETEVALANETHTNMWLNVPTYATDDYVRQEMTYVHDHLDPSLSVDLEYSNEVWNFQFQQAGYAGQQGAKLWDKDANGDGVIDESDPAEHDAGDWVIWDGYRSAQIASIAKQVFGSDDDRLHDVLATQTGYEGLENYIIEGVKRAGLGSVSDLFDDYAVTDYFGGDLKGATAADRATIVGWAKEGDAGVTAAIAAIKDGTGLSSDQFSIADETRILVYQGAVAQKLGLNLVAYEGGLDVNADAFGADAPLVTDFLKRVQADPRMGDLYTQMMSAFSAQGGTLDNFLTDADSGFYGTLKSIYDAGSPEFDALVAAEQAATAGSVSPALTTAVPVPPPTTTSASYTMAAGETAIAYAGTGQFTAVANNLADTIIAGNGGSFITGGAGTDTLTGGTGVDAFSMGADLNPLDRITGGGSSDQVGIQGDYTGAHALVLQDTTLTGISVLAAMPGYSYDITSADGNVAAGQTLTVYGSNLGAGDNLTFNGSAETDGKFLVYGGLGTNTLTGGAGDDAFYFGPGKWKSGDVVHGGGGNDELALDGNYTVTLDSHMDVGTVVLTPGPSGDANTFDVTVDNSFVAPGGHKMVYAKGVATDVTIDAHTETNGSLTLYGGNGNDTLIGGVGNDVLWGGSGTNTLTGGAGADRFYFQTGDLVADPTKTTTITDFSRADGDKIDLSGYDADPSKPSFTFIGTAAFSGHAGELRIDTSGANQLVSVDLNGDGVADFTLNVSKGSGALIATDFIL